MSAKLIYSMGISLDGYIAGPDGSFDWSVPDEEQHRFHNEQVGELGMHLLGRRLYETMVYWETAGEDPSISDYALEFAQIWKALPKVVFSTTLDEVVGNTKLVRGDVTAEVARLKEEEDGDIAVGGAGLAATLIRAGLVDEFRPFVNPVAVGGGTPYFPLEHRTDLELLETRTFRTRVVFLRYRRTG
ncbi:MAG: dihydrofolate reductase family protein [Thermoleophilaceae bacterium]